MNILHNAQYADKRFHDLKIPSMFYCKRVFPPNCLYCSHILCGKCMWFFFQKCFIASISQMKQRRKFELKRKIDYCNRSMQAADLRFQIADTFFMRRRIEMGNVSNILAFERSLIFAFSPVLLSSMRQFLICWWESRILIQADQRNRNLHFDLETHILWYVYQCSIFTMFSIYQNAFGLASLR